MKYYKAPKMYLPFLDDNENRHFVLDEVEIPTQAG